MHLTHLHVSTLCKYCQRYFGAPCHNLFVIFDRSRPVMLNQQINGCVVTLPAGFSPRYRGYVGETGQHRTRIQRGRGGGGQCTTQERAPTLAWGQIDTGRSGLIWQSRRRLIRIWINGATTVRDWRATIGKEGEHYKGGCGEKQLVRVIEVRTND